MLCKTDIFNSFMLKLFSESFLWFSFLMWENLGSVNREIFLISNIFLGKLNSRIVNHFYSLAYIKQTLMAVWKSVGFVIKGTRV